MQIAAGKQIGIGAFKAQNCHIFIKCVSSLSGSQEAIHWFEVKVMGNTCEMFVALLHVETRCSVV